MNTLMIADDLTGAGDSGAQMVHRGSRAFILFRWPDRCDLSSATAIVDTNSREMSGRQAADCIKRMVGPLFRESSGHSPSDGWTFDVCFKKIDSTLRGNIGAEVSAVCELYRPDLVVLAPAFPAKGRTIVNSLCYVHGRLLHDTEMFADVKASRLHSDVAEIWRRQLRAPVGTVMSADLDSGDGRLLQIMRRHRNVSCDTRTDDDLRMIVRAARQAAERILWVGSAGLAAAVADATGEPVRRRGAGKLRCSPVLTVIGSLNSASRTQLACLLRHPDCLGMEIDAAEATAANRTGLSERIERLSRAAVLNGKDVVLYSAARPAAMPASRESAKRIADHLGFAAARAIASLPFEAAVLSGGETARSVLNHLQADGIEILGEIEAGVPVGKAIGVRNFHVVTKSGAFGQPDILLKSIAYLKGRAEREP